MFQETVIVLDVKLNEWSGLVTLGSVVFVRAFANVLVRFRFLKARSIVSARMLRALVRQQLAPLTDVSEWAHAVRPLLAIRQTPMT